MTGAVVAASAAIAIAMLPIMATPASATGTWTLTISGTSGATTTGVVVSGTVNPNGDTAGGFAYVVYEPVGTAFSSTSPTAGCVDEGGTFDCDNDLIFSAGDTTTHNVSIVVSQLTPNTAYHFELQAEDDDGNFSDSATTGTFSTTPVPPGPGTPINPTNNPSSNGIFGQCTTDSSCVSDMNGVRAAQEQLPPLALPSNWGSLTGPEQIFVWTNLERTSRGEAAIPNLVNTWNSNIQTGLADGDDPSFTGVPCCGGSIWSGYPTVLSSMYGWQYNDGPGGTNEDCTGTDTSGCWGHRDAILGNANNFSGNPTEMDAGAGTETGGSADFDALIDPNPNPANIVFTWAQEQPFLSATPAVTSISPTSGPTGGGTTVTITGTNLTGATKVLFGTVAATSFTVVSSTEITAVSPAQAAGFHNIYVTTPNGTSAAVTGDQFTYLNTQPAVTGISPTSGSTDGGTTVTITGTNLNGASKVLFGTVAATSFTVVSSTEITAVSPAQAAGEHNIYVTTPGGTSAAVTADEFTYKVFAPSISGISPTSGPTTGGTTVTIDGADFTGASKVLFGTVAATSFTVVSQFEITAVSPAQAVGEHNIYITTPGGTSAPVSMDEFTYVKEPAPSISGISPTSGSTGGGTTVTIDGADFTGATKVLFGTVAATSFTVVSQFEITAVSPAQAAGEHNIYITTPSGTSAPVSMDEFTYKVLPPSVTAISPTSGPNSGGTTVTITGTGFTGATKVLFGTVAATSFTVVSSTKITAVSPAQAAAQHNIYVTASTGTSAAVTADEFTYTG